LGAITESISNGSCMTDVASGIMRYKKVEGKKFSDRQLQISNKGDMDAQNFNFAAKVCTKFGNSTPKLCIFEVNCATRINFPSG